MFTGAQDWSNWFAVRDVLQQELAKGPFIAVHGDREDIYYVSGTEAGSGRCVEIRLGCVDAYIAKEAPKLGLAVEQTRWDHVEHLHAFPGYGDDVTVTVMARAMNAEIPDTNHGYAPATAAARRLARSQA